MSFIDRLSALVDWFDFLPMSNRNYVVDGNFDQWTASSAAASASGFQYGPAVMFLSYAGAGGAATISQSAQSGGEPAGSTSPVNYVYSHQQTTSSTGTVGTNSPGILQRIESVKTLQGKSATFSCWLWCASGTVQISNLIASQSFGTGGSPSAAVVMSPNVNWTVTTTPQKFSVRIDWPSIAGKTLGTNNDHNLQIGLWLPSGSTFTLNTMQWQLEQCSPQAPSTGRPTAFEYRGYQAELARVQRYYEFEVAGQTCAGNAPFSGWNLYARVSYRTSKRVVGTFTASWQGQSGVGSNSISGAGLSGVDVILSSNTTGNFYGTVTWTADARL